MSKQRLMPAEHWDWSMPVTLSQGWKTDGLILVGGQISADARGKAVGKDIETQTRNIMAFIGRVLSEAGASFSDLVKQNIYYVVDEQSPAPSEIIRRIEKIQSEYLTTPGPVTTATPVAGLAFEGLLLEIDAIAAAGLERQPLTADGMWDSRGGVREVQGYRVGDWVFIGGQRSIDRDRRLQGRGDIATQTRICFEAMRGVLTAAGADFRDLMRLNTYYQHDGVGHEITRFWEELTKVRLAFLPDPGPVGTAVRVSGFPIDGELFQIEGIAHLGKSRKRIMPQNHWGWSMPVPFSQGWRVGKVVFCGGQISADRSGRTLGVNAIEAQTANVFESLISVLKEAGADMSDVVKLNTYYKYEGVGTDVTQYWEKMTGVRRRYFPPQGASATAVRVDGYAFEDLLIEVEAIAVIDR